MSFSKKFISMIAKKMSGEKYSDEQLKASVQYIQDTFDKMKEEGSLGEGFKWKIERSTEGLNLTTKGSIDIAPFVEAINNDPEKFIGITWAYHYGSIIHDSDNYEVFRQQFSEEICSRIYSNDKNLNKTPSLLPKEKGKYEKSILDPSYNANGEVLEFYDQDVSDWDVSEVYDMRAMFDKDSDYDINSKP